MTNYRKQIFCEVLILGGGGAGLTAAIIASKQGFKTYVISKSEILQSHTIAAQGGINAALDPADDWRFHAYDTVKSGDYLADQDSVATMCYHAPEAIAWLKELGVDNPA